MQARAPPPEAPEGAQVWAAQRSTGGGGGLERACMRPLGTLASLNSFASLGQVHSSHSQRHHHHLNNNSPYNSGPRRPPLLPPADVPMRPALWAALLLGLVAVAAAQSNPTPAIVNGQDAPRGRSV